MLFFSVLSGGGTGWSVIDVSFHANTDRKNISCYGVMNVSGINAVLETRSQHATCVQL